MSSLPASISALFERQSVPNLLQNLRAAFAAGDTALFDGAVSWRLQAFEAERIWDGQADSFDDMAAAVIGTLNGFDAEEDEQVQLMIEAA